MLLGLFEEGDEYSAGSLDFKGLRILKREMMELMNFFDYPERQTLPLIGSNDRISSRENPPFAWKSIHVF